MHGQQTIKFISESTLLLNAPRFTQKHCFLKGFQASPLCSSGKSNIVDYGDWEAMVENQSTIITTVAITVTNSSTTNLTHTKPRSNSALLGG
jgi:hypothetical protein